MPLILRRPRDALLFRAGVATTARSLSELVDQLQNQLRESQEQLKAEREQRAFEGQYYEGEIRRLLRDLIQLKYEAARNAFAAAPSPSAAVH